MLHPIRLHSPAGPIKQHKAENITNTDVHRMDITLVDLIADINQDFSIRW